MARNKTLLQLTEEVRAETRRSTSASRGIDDLDHIRQVIRRIYEQFYDDYDWPHTKVMRDITIAAGSRYYDFPTDVDYERVRTVKYDYGTIWTDVEYGITDDEYSAFDTERTDPILKWDIIDAGSGEQIEVWPLPASAGTLRIRGIRNKTELVSNSDICDLDSTLIVMFAAAEILASAGQKDATLKLQAGQKRLNSLRARSFKRKKMDMPGSGPSREQPKERIRVVAVQ